MIIVMKYISYYDDCGCLLDGVSHNGSLYSPLALQLQWLRFETCSTYSRVNVSHGGVILTAHSLC